MLETNMNNVRNLETGVEKDVIVKMTPYSLKDIVIAGIIMLAGFAYMTVTAFNNGARAYVEAEDNALIDAGIAHKGPGIITYDEDTKKYIFTSKAKQ